MRVVKSQLTYCLELMSVMSDRTRGMRLTDLALHLDAPKSSTQRLLEHLAQDGWVEQDEATGQYRLTMRLAMLGQRYLQSAGIADPAQAILERLARQTKELARLTVVDRKQLAWIGSAQGAPPGLRYEPSMGGSIVSFATANGKAWLATFGDDEAIAIAMKDGLGKRARRVGLGPRSLKTADGLRADLHMRAQARLCHCRSRKPRRASRPSRSRSRSRTAISRLGTTSIAGPVVRITPDRHAEIVGALRTSAADFASGVACRAAQGNRCCRARGCQRKTGAALMGAGGIGVSGIRKVFGGEATGTVALERIDLDIAAGEFVSVVGPSGCGKSTLLRMISGSAARDRRRNLGASAGQCVVPSSTAASSSSSRSCSNGAPFSRTCCSTSTCAASIPPPTGRKPCSYSRRSACAISPTSGPTNCPAA